MTAIVSESGIDTGAPWHYGDPMREQRLLDAGTAVVDLSHRGVVSVTGPDRLSWLHSLTTQHLERLEPVSASPPWCSRRRATSSTCSTESTTVRRSGRTPNLAPPRQLVTWLDRMRFMMRVEVLDRTADFGLVWSRGSLPADGLSPSQPRFARRPGPVRLPRRPAGVLAQRSLAGMWAYEALRIAAGVPRIGLDTDHRTIPNEIGLLGVAVHLDKGCYRGQETVARVHTLGRPPRRLVRLHLDGSVDALPAPGAALESDGRAVGFVGGSARHFELGPIALGMIKRNVARRCSADRRRHRRQPGSAGRSRDRPARPPQL